MDKFILALSWVGLGIGGIFLFMFFVLALCADPKSQDQGRYDKILSNSAKAFWYGIIFACLSAIPLLMHYVL